MRLIVLLEDPDTIDPAKGYEETGRSASDREPCFCTPFRKRFGIRQGIRRWLAGLFCIFKLGVRKFLRLLVTVFLQAFYRDLGIMTSVSKLRVGFGHDCKGKAACSIRRILKKMLENVLRVL